MHGREYDHLVSQQRQRHHLRYVPARTNSFRWQVVRTVHRKDSYPSPRTKCVLAEHLPEIAGSDLCPSNVSLACVSCRICRSIVNLILNTRQYVRMGREPRAALLAHLLHCAFRSPFLPCELTLRAVGNASDNDVGPAPHARAAHHPRAPPALLCTP
jgi:hypothetical protein